MSKEMNLKQILEHLQQVEKELAPLVEQEEEKRTGQPMMYCFVYEQRYDDVPGEWGPNNQLVEARDVAEAFAAFGYVVKQMDLTVRNIRYGAYSEMEEEMQAISDYWSNYHRQRKEAK